MIAAGNNFIEVVKLLIRAGADVNTVNDEGETALWIAAQCSNREIMTLLIDAGADPNLTNHLGLILI